MTAIRRLLLIYTGVLLGLVLAIPAGAVTLDEATRALERNQRIYDFAGVLSQQDASAIRRQLENLERSGVAEGAVVVADRLEGATIKEFALALGESWKIGGRGVDNGFVLLVSIEDRSARIETGYGLEGLLPDAAAERVLRRELVPAFRSEQYGEGIAATLDAIRSELQRAGGAEALADATVPQPTPGVAYLALFLGAAAVATAFFAWPRGATPGHDPWRMPGMLLGFGSFGCAVYAAMQSPGQSFSLLLSGIPGGLYAGIRALEGAWVPMPLDGIRRSESRGGAGYWVLLTVGSVVWLFVSPTWWLVPFLLLMVPLGLAMRGYLHRVPRRCPECAGPLRWLPEREEAAFLHSDEELEQRLGSVDYDIWRCRKCERSAIFARDQVEAPYTECPRCHRRSLGRRTVVDRASGSWREAWANDVVECHNPRCGYTDVTQRRVDYGGRRGADFEGGGFIIIPPIFGGWGGGWGGHFGDAGGGDFGNIDLGDFGGGGGFGGGGADVDW